MKMYLREAVLESIIKMKFELDGNSEDFPGSLSTIRGETSSSYLMTLLAGYPAGIMRLK